MSEEKEYQEFRKLYDMSGGGQMDRIISRLDMHKFVKKHGKEKCDRFMDKIFDMAQLNVPSDEVKP